MAYEVLAPVHMNGPATSTADLETLPLYREGDTDEASWDRLQADRPAFIVRAYREAGPIFRMPFDGRRWVVMAGVEANDFVWRNTELWNYPVMFPAFLEQMGPDHLNCLEGEGHRHKRTILKPAFDQGAAMRYLADFNRHFHTDLAGAVGGVAIDLVEFWAETITRANTRTVVQAEVAEPALKRLVRWEREMLAGIALGEARHAHYARPEYLELKAEAMALMHRILAERLAEPGRHDDNFAGVLRARRDQPGGYPDRSWLVDDLYYILVAGVENTSRLINWTALHCHFAPVWAERVRAELADWDGQDVRALGAMTHLKAVIMETQRLRPPAFFTVRQSTREFEFGGQRVPAGTNVLVANVAAHFLEEIYEDPFSFRPERFVASGRFEPRTNGFFGGGVHLCVGRNHAMLQTPVALAQLLKYHVVSYRDEATLREIIAQPGRAVPAEIWGEVKPRPL